MNVLLKTVCAGLLAGVPLLAGAQENSMAASPYYVGGSWGAGTEYRFGCYGQDCSHTTSRSGKLYGGYTFNHRTAFGDMKVTDSVELSLFRASGSSTATPFAGNTARNYANFTGMTATWATAMSLTDKLALDSRLGLSYVHTKWDSSMSTADSYLPTHGNGNRIGPTAGVGLAYALNPNWKLHADFDYIPVSYGSARDKNHLNVWSVGASYHF